MASILRVWFSGLCQFIENKEPDEGTTCVVLVRALDHDAGIYKLDWSKKKFKRGRPLGDEIICLDGHYVSFEIKDGLKQSFDVPLEYEDYGRIEMEDLVGDFADGDTGAVDYEPTPEIQKKIVGQVYIKGERRGSVRSKAAIDRWEIPDTVNEEFRRSMEIADPVFIERSGVGEVVLVVTSFEGEVVLRKRLKADKDGNFEIIITNNCTRPRRYFRWIIDKKEVRLIQVDRDFMHHYQLLNPKALKAIDKLPRISRGNEYPVPERTLFLMSSLRRIPSGWRKLPTQFEIPSPRFKTLGHFFLQVVLSLVLELPSTLGMKRAVFGQRKLKHLEQAFLLLSQKFGPRGSGVGSGCDCLPCGGRSQFFEIPSPTRPNEESSRLTAPPPVP
jgi:hypothetical protein